MALTNNVRSLFCFSIGEVSGGNKFLLQLASDLHLQTHLRGTRHNQLLIERFNQKNENGVKKQPTQEDIVNRSYFPLAFRLN